LGYSPASAEIAKKAQADTLELMTAAGKNLGDEATLAAKATSHDATSATKTAAAN